MTKYKAGDMARRLDIHPNTVRRWAIEYKSHFSPGAIGKRRIFTDDDLRVLATIAAYRDQGISPAEVERMLAAGQRVENIPPPVTEAEEAARRNVRLVPVAQYERALDRIQQLENELDRLTAERDSAALDQQAITARIETLQRELGTLQGQVAERQPAAYWLKLLALAVLGALALGAALAVLVLLAAR